MSSSIDASDFEKKARAMLGKMGEIKRKATMDVASEVLRLSQREVPHDTGELQNSGHAEPEGDGAMVGYNKVYAARLHEHPEYRFQKGRKGKYLEDPILNNMSRLRDYIVSAFQGGL